MPHTAQSKALPVQMRVLWLFKAGTTKLSDPKTVMINFTMRMAVIPVFVSLNMRTEDTIMSITQKKQKATGKS